MSHRRSGRRPRDSPSPIILSAKSNVRQIRTKGQTQTSRKAPTLKTAKMRKKLRRRIIQTEAAEVVLRDINLRLLGTKSIIQLCIAKHMKIGIMFSFFGITEFSSYFKKGFALFPCSPSWPSTNAT
jgi:hypothetical protein